MQYVTYIGVARGSAGVQVHPQRENSKFWGLNLDGDSLYGAPLEGENSFFCGRRVRVVNLGGSVY